MRLKVPTFRRARAPMIPITAGGCRPGGRVLMPMRAVVRERAVVRSPRDYLG